MELEYNTLMISAAIVFLFAFNRIVYSFELLSALIIENRTINMETLTSKERLIVLARTEDEQEYRDMSENDMMDCANLMQQWGFDDVRCHNCGVLNSQCNGLLMQCAKCKKAYYCSSECFNKHLSVHRLTCDVGNFAHRNPILLNDTESERDGDDRSNSSIAEKKRDNSRKKKAAKSSKKKSRRSSKTEYHYQHVYPGGDAEGSSEDKLLVLYASKTKSKKQHRRIKKTFEMLDENEVIYEALDSKDPSNKERCEGLYAMSGRSNEFPQFFRTTADGDADYIGGWAEFEGTVESEFDDTSESDNSLAAFIFADHKLRRKASIWKPRSQPTIIVDSDDEKEVKHEKQNKDDKRPSCPVRQHTGDSESFLILYTSEPEDRSQLVDQQMLAGLLDGNDIRYDVLDGMNPSTEETRDALFDLSGKSERYPQIFKGESDGRIEFWGAFSDFQKVARQGGLVPPGRMKRRRNRKSNDKKLTLPLETLFEETEDDLLEFDDSDLIAMQRPTDQDNCADSRPKRPVRRNSGTLADSETLLVLYTSKTKKAEEVATQQMMTGVLEGCNLKYDALDGSNPDNMSKRDELFKISGRKNEYPQFYTVGLHGTKFLGGWDEFDEASREGDLDQFVWDDDDGEGKRRKRRGKKKNKADLPSDDKPRKPTRTFSDEQEIAEMPSAATASTTGNVSKTAISLRGSEIVKKAYEWEKPDWVKNFPFKRRSYVEPSRVPTEKPPEFDRKNIDLQHAEIKKNTIEWEVPEWAKRCPLRKTSKGQLLQSLGDFEGYKHIKSPKQPPEWVVHSPLKKKRSPVVSPSSFTEGSDDGIINPPNLAGLPSKLPLD